MCFLPFARRGCRRNASSSFSHPSSRSRPGFIYIHIPPLTPTSAAITTTSNCLPTPERNWAYLRRSPRHHCTRSPPCFSSAGTCTCILTPFHRYKQQVIPRSIRKGYALRHRAALHLQPACQVGRENAARCPSRTMSRRKISGISSSERLRREGGGVEREREAARCPIKARQSSAERWGGVDISR